MVPEATIAQRITRAKRTLSEQAVAFELPRPEDLSARLESVLEVICLTFNEAGMAFGPEAALAIVEPLLDDPTLTDYAFLPSVRADCLAKLGRLVEAKAEVERAAALTKNARERSLLLERAAAYARAQTAVPK